MVRIARFAFDEGMHVDLPEPRDGFDEDDLDDFVQEGERPLKAPRPSRRERRRNQPDDRRPDRRQSPGDDDTNPDRPTDGSDRAGKPV
jgi:hypothetical protein